MRALTRALGVLTLLGAAAGRAPAQTPSSYDACYVPNVGALYLIKLTGLPSQCLAAGHVAINWTNGALPDGAVTTAKLADGAVTAAKLASGAVDHGSLGGLADDDHPQYLLANGVRNAANGFAVTGNYGSGTVPVAGAGVRLMWYPIKAAFRVGQAVGAEWDDASVGTASTAMGYNTTASGPYSMAMGSGTAAGGYGAVATGLSTDASGQGSIATGSATTASGQTSTAMGDNTTASAYASTAMGLSTTASGDRSIAMGAGATASGYTSTAMGAVTTASGTYATAMGSFTTASGNNATAMGQTTTAQAFGSLVIGRYNVVAGTIGSWVATEPLFVAGNGTGTGGSAANALTLLKNGNMTIAGTLTQNSDIRLKEQVEPVDQALDGVLRLTPIRYRFRDGTAHPAEHQIGLSAQDVQRVFPELVSQDAQGYLSVAYSNMTAVLVRALQEQQARIVSLQDQVLSLRERMARLEVQVAGTGDTARR